MAAALGVAALAALAGCGDDGPGREAFAREADAVCAPALAKLRAVRERVDATAAGADPDAIFRRTAELLREGAAISRATFDRIESLEEPADGAGAVDDWVAANRRQAALTAELAAAFAAQDETRIARLSGEVDALDQRNNAAARRLGMRACAARVEG